jgi:hypothetical protein
MYSKYCTIRSAVKDFILGKPASPKHTVLYIVKYSFDFIVYSTVLYMTFYNRKRVE